MRRLGAQVRWPVAAEEARRTFRFLSALVESVPVWELSFAPRFDVWDLIAAPFPEVRGGAA
jgi:hypothetical protein